MFTAISQSEKQPLYYHIQMYNKSKIAYIRKPKPHPTLESLNGRRAMTSWCFYAKTRYFIEWKVDEITFLILSQTYFTHKEEKKMISYYKNIKDLSWLIQKNYKSNRQSADIAHSDCEAATKCIASGFQLVKTS